MTLPVSGEVTCQNTSLVGTFQFQLHSEELPVAEESRLLQVSDNFHSQRWVVSSDYLSGSEQKLSESSRLYTFSSSHSIKTI